jgi:hypothetical protein
MSEKEINQLKMDLEIAREERRAAIGRLLMLEMEISSLLKKKSKIPMGREPNDLRTPKITTYDMGYEHAIRDVLRMFSEKRM